MPNGISWTSRDRATAAALESSHRGLPAQTANLFVVVLQRSRPRNLPLICPICASKSASCKCAIVIVSLGGTNTSHNWSRVWPTPHSGTRTRHQRWPMLQCFEALSNCRAPVAKNANENQNETHFEPTYDLFSFCSPGDIPCRSSQLLAALVLLPRLLLSPFAVFFSRPCTWPSP